MAIQPFTIHVAQDVLDDLQQRLANTRWPDEVMKAGWDYGTNRSYLQDIVAYWHQTYDWQTQETQLNQFEHFRAEIDGFGLHFIHERGKGSNPIPILLLHGWPDSFYRFYKLIPMLINPKHFDGENDLSFDVIVPSLPGFGFSDKPLQRGGVDTLSLLHKLMVEELGYNNFSVHAGDTGSLLAKEMATHYPDVVDSIHLTDIGYDAPFGLDPSTMSTAEQDYVAQVEQWSASEGAYFMIQSTKPQSLAYGLTDSPVGLAAWILQHFYAWSDCEGDIERSFSKEELLTNIMIYWFTETINSSIRWYYDGTNTDWESFDAENIEWDAPEETKTNVPVGVTLFPKDLPGIFPPRELAERTLNVQHWSEMPYGGHFAALEAPELLAQDMRTFFLSLR